jgi:hypothetical protein
MWKATPPEKWRPARFGGSGSIAVEKVGVVPEIYGLAKPRSVVNEKLASDLAALAGVKVPKVELDNVEGQPGLHSISRSHGKESIDVAKLRGLPDQMTSPQVKTAFARASGLLAFHAWVATQDLKDDHIVLDMDNPDAYEFAAIDFESSLGWPAGDGGDVQAPSGGLPKEMFENVDKAVVAATVDRIEAITDEQIRNIVNAIPDVSLSEGEKKRVVDGLIGRRSKMRDAMKRNGWLT